MGYYIAGSVGLQLVTNAMAGNAIGDATVEGAETRAEIQTLNIEAQKEYKQLAKDVFEKYRSYGVKRTTALRQAGRTEGDPRKDINTQNVLNLAKTSLGDMDKGQLGELER